MSDGLYEAYEAWTGRPERVNDDIAHLVAQELKNCHDLKMVAQNVVEKVKHLYRDTCKRERRSGRLDDITLVVKSLMSGGPPSTYSSFSRVPSDQRMQHPQVDHLTSAPVTNKQFDFRTQPPQQYHHHGPAPQHPPPSQGDYWRQPRYDRPPPGRGEYPPGAFGPAEHPGGYYQHPPDLPYPAQQAPAMWHNREMGGRGGPSYYVGQKSYPPRSEGGMNMTQAPLEPPRQYHPSYSTPGEAAYSVGGGAYHAPSSTPYGEPAHHPMYYSPHATPPYPQQPPPQQHARQGSAPDPGNFTSPHDDRMYENVPVAATTSPPAPTAEAKHQLSNPPPPLPPRTTPSSDPPDIPPRARPPSESNTEPESRQPPGPSGPQTTAAEPSGVSSGGDNEEFDMYGWTAPPQPISQASPEKTSPQKEPPVDPLKEPQSLIQEPQTLKEEVHNTETQPPTEVSKEDDPMLADRPPETLSEGGGAANPANGNADYVIYDEDEEYFQDEEEEEEVDNTDGNATIKPYIRFNTDRFPVDLSWSDIKIDP